MWWKGKESGGGDSTDKKGGNVCGNGTIECSVCVCCVCVCGGVRAYFRAALALRTRRLGCSRHTRQQGTPCSSRRFSPVAVAVAEHRPAAVAVAGSSPVAVAAGSTVAEAVAAGSSPVAVVAGTCFPFHPGSSSGSGCLDLEEGLEELGMTFSLAAGRRRGCNAVPRQTEAQQSTRASQPAS